jgi:hypothetical protein
VPGQREDRYLGQARSSTPSALELIRLREALPRSLLHLKVKEASLDIFNAGRFEAAVFEAFKLVEIAVREDAGYTERDYGTDMVARAFNADNGPLSDAAKPDAERQAMQTEHTASSKTLEVIGTWI